MRRQTEDIEALEALDDESGNLEITQVTEVEVTRGQIEQTRSDMSDTLEAIKEKLNPQMLAQQAKHTVHDVTADMVQQAKDTVHDVTADLVQQARTTIHQVTADAVQQAKDALPEMTSRAAHGAVEGAVNTAKEAVGGAVSTAKDAVEDAVDTARGAGSSLVATIRANPLPAALAGLGLGWLYMSMQKQRSLPSRSMDSRYRFSEATSYPSRPVGYQGFSEAPYSASSYGRSAEGSYPSTYPRGGEEQGNGGSSVGQTLREAGGRVGEFANQAQEKVGEVAGQAQEKLGAVAVQVRDQAARLGTQAHEQAERAAEGFHQMLWQNPLAVGAVATTLGVAIGLVVPETRSENRLMGEVRDRFVDKAQETAQDLGLKAQIVAEEAIDSAKAEARSQGLIPEGKPDASGTPSQSGTPTAPGSETRSTPSTSR